MKMILAQLNYTVGDFEGNYEKIMAAYKPVQNEDALLVCSELAISGYYPQDLVNKATFIQKQDEVLTQLLRDTRGKKCAMVIGYIAQNTKSSGKRFHNALGVFFDGKQIFEYHKKLLPTYNVFDEARHFAVGEKDSIMGFRNYRIGFLICEDAWAESNDFKYKRDPVKQLVDQSLDIVISINASPNNLGKINERLDIMRKVALKTRAPVLYLNQIGGNDELVFDGSSFILNSKGQLVYQMKSFEQQIGQVELNAIQTLTPQTVSLDKTDILLKQISLGIRDYVRKCGFKQVVIGASGGVDSAVTLALCVEALGALNVTAITMPSIYSSKGSVNDSAVLCENLGVKLLHASIVDEFNLVVKRFKSMTGKVPSRLTQENMQARIRGRILMEYSNHFGALVISTGNKSEMSVGYATLYGDMNGGINPLGDLYKMEVYELANYMNQINNAQLIPAEIISKEPSAELSENQQDSDALPEYLLLDAILKLYLEGDLLTEKQRLQCKQTILHAHSNEKLIQHIHGLVDHAEFKRRQAPPIIRVQKRSFGMGRWLPIAAKYG